MKKWKPTHVLCAFLSAITAHIIMVQKDGVVYRTSEILHPPYVLGSDGFVIGWEDDSFIAPLFVGAYCPTHLIYAQTNDGVVLTHVKCVENAQHQCVYYTKHDIEYRSRPSWVLRSNGVLYQVQVSAWKNTHSVMHHGAFAVSGATVCELHTVACNYRQ